MRLTGGGGSRPAGRVLRRAGMMQHGGKRARTHELDAAAAGEEGGFGHCMAPQQYPMGMQAMEHMVGMPPSMSASRGVGRMPMPHGSMADPYGSAPHFGGVRMMPAPPRREDMGLSSGFLSRNEQIETLIKMVLNAIIVQSEDEVFVPYGVAKKDGAAKVASSAVKDEEHGGEPGPGADGGGDDGGRDDVGEVAAEVHGAQGAPSVHDGAHAMGDGCGETRFLSADTHCRSIYRRPLHCCCRRCCCYRCCLLTLIAFLYLWLSIRVMETGKINPAFEF